MAEMEKKIVRMTQKPQKLELETVTRVPEIYLQIHVQFQRGMSKNTLKNISKNCRSYWGHQLKGGKRKDMIRI